VPDDRTEAPAVIRRPRAKNQLPEAAVDATVVEVMANGFGVRVDPGIDLAANRMIEIGFGGAWTRARVIWSARGIGDVLIAGVELTEPRPVRAPVSVLQSGEAQRVLDLDQARAPSFDRTSDRAPKSSSMAALETGRDRK
jgi:hypothetical protein